MMGATLSRRDLGVVTVGAGLAAVTPPARAAVALDTPQQILDALVRMRGAGEGRAAFWWLTETVYGVVGSQITPLYAGHVGSIARTTRNADGSHSQTQLETVFWTMLDGARELSVFKNPYTGADNPMTPLVMGPHMVRLTTSGTEAPPSAPGGKMEFASSHGPVVRVGDDVFISSDVMATVTFDDVALRSRSVNDLATYQARMTDLASGADFVPSWVTFQSIASWPSALNMGSRDGHMVARAAGAKVKSIDAMPKTWLTLAERHAPHLLNDPIGALSRPPAKLG
ncbi:MAG: hypothetical protein FJX59_00405 [Alphaproteobacteria bacterium]|nr:hypothetical protein [Alphaproteobacteria bacterium]